VTVDQSPPLTSSPAPTGTARPGVGPSVGRGQYLVGRRSRSKFTLLHGLAWHVPIVSMPSGSSAAAAAATVASAVIEWVVFANQ